MCKNDYTDISKEKKFASPSNSFANNSQPNADIAKLGSVTDLKSKFAASIENDYQDGEYSTTRKRRLMLLDDAAGSSVNLKNQSAEFGSAGRGSALNGSQYSRRI